MEFVKLIYSNREHYSYKDASNVEMSNLGIFLAYDVGCSGRGSFKQFALNEWETGTSSNATHLEKEGDYVFLSSLHSDEEEPPELKMTLEQFIKLLDDWEEKVCKAKPKKVVIKHENDQFIFETSN